MREHLADLRQRRESLAQRSRGPLARQRGFKLLLLQEEEFLCECELLLDGTAMAGELCRERVATRCAFDDAGRSESVGAAVLTDPLSSGETGCLSSTPRCGAAEGLPAAEKFLRYPGEDFPNSCLGYGDGDMWTE